MFSNAPNIAGCPVDSLGSRLAKEVDAVEVVEEEAEEGEAPPYGGLLGAHDPT